MLFSRHRDNIVFIFLPIVGWKYACEIIAFDTSVLLFWWHYSNFGGKLQPTKADITSCKNNTNIKHVAIVLFLLGWSISFTESFLGPKTLERDCELVS